MEVKKQIYLSHLAYESFNDKNLRSNSITFKLINAFLIAFCLSFFIYAKHFGISNQSINLLLALVGLFGLIVCDKKTMFFTGFFIGVLWFYWISLSFRYYDLPYLIPFVILGVGLIYAFIFFFIAWIGKIPEIRALLIFSLSFFAPFGFNWFKLELIFIETYLPSHPNVLLIIFIGIILLIRMKRYWKIFALVPLAFIPSLTPLHVHKIPNIDTEIPNINLSQDKKWKKEFQSEIIKNNLFLINKAIGAKKEMIILPESAFPLYLNEHKLLQIRLKELSYNIAIITGALSWENGNILNSTYIFQKGEMQIAHKVVLVPFGEQIPLPKFARSFINDIFFDGAEDYKSAEKPFDFKIKDYTFRNAICFEATTDKLFKGSPRFMIAISNNAWFTPSIEPTLQNLLLRYYASKYNTTIYHSANGGISGVIK